MGPLPRRPPSLLFALALSLSVLPLRAAAQDEFDDEWETGFEEQEEAAPQEEEEGAPDEEEGVDDDLEDAEAEDHDAGNAEDEDEAAPGEDRRPGSDFVPAEPAWDRAYRAQGTLFGGSGGLHVLGAEGLPTGVFRIQLGLDFFAASNYVFDEDTHSRVGGWLSLAGQLHDLVELYGSIRSFATSNTRNDPALFLVLGDVRAGVKVFFHPIPWLGLGAALEAWVPTSGDLGVDSMALGGNLFALATADLRELESPAPFIARLSIGYRMDNSAALINGLENRRYLALTDAMVPMENESRHLATRYERTALAVSRTDAFDVRIGLEAPLRVTEGVFISPLLEWAWGVPINRSGYDCLFVPSAPGSDVPAAGEESCLAYEGIGAAPMSLSLGLRVMPKVPGFTAFAAVDIGLTGTSRDSSVRELPLNAPYDVILGVAYAFDTRPDPVPEVIRREVDKEVEVPEEPPPAGRIIGTVVQQQDGSPVDRAIVDFPATPYSAILAENGHFTSDRFPPGTRVEMNVTADEHDPGTCEGTIPEDGSDVEVRCELVKHVLVQVEESEIRILEQINFAFDNDQILPTSFHLMDAIARVIIDNPQIRRIEVQGHTDDSGTERYNESLSQRRVTSVVRGLVERGVAADRLTPVGYGEARPIVPNDSDENRGRNRRVQFVILERDDAAGGEEVQGRDTPTEAPAP